MPATGKTGMRSRTMCLNGKDLSVGFLSLVFIFDPGRFLMGHRIDQGVYIFFCQDLSHFAPNMTKITAADHQVGGCFYRLCVLFGIKKYAANLGNLLVIGGIVFRFG